MLGQTQPPSQAPGSHAPAAATSIFPPSIIQALVRSTPSTTKFTPDNVTEILRELMNAMAQRRQNNSLHFLSPTYEMRVAFAAKANEALAQIHTNNNTVLSSSPPARRESLSEHPFKSPATVNSHKEQASPQADIGVTLDNDVIMTSASRAPSESGTGPALSDQRSESVSMDLDSEASSTPQPSVTRSLQHEASDTISASLPHPSTSIMPATRKPSSGPTGTNVVRPAQSALFELNDGQLMVDATGLKQRNQPALAPNDSDRAEISNATSEAIQQQPEAQSSSLKTKEAVLQERNYVPGIWSLVHGQPYADIAECSFEVDPIVFGKWNLETRYAALARF